MKQLLSYTVNYVKNLFIGIDTPLLVFLLLFLNVKLAVKVAAIVLIYIWRSNFKFGFSLKQSRLPLFYLLIPAIGILNWVIGNPIHDTNYILVVLTGIMFWLLCLLVSHQLKLSVERNEAEVIHKTIATFFIINAIVSFGMYGIIVLKTGSINPYTYQGQYQKYFIGTGDYIKGIAFDTSTTNAIINAFGVIYFITRDKIKMTMMCMAVLLMCGSNTINILLIGIFLFQLIFSSTKLQKSIIVICSMMLYIFLGKISPENSQYISQTWEKLTGTEHKEDTTYKNIPITYRPDSTLNDEEKKIKIATIYTDSINRLIDLRNRELRKKFHIPDSLLTITGKPHLPRADINGPWYQHRFDTTAEQRKLLVFYASHESELEMSNIQPWKVKMPGKIIALNQTIQYFKTHKHKLVLGTGMGNFSSKLAFRTTALNIGGGYPENYAYFNDAFERNHLSLYFYFFTKEFGLHSITNTPHNTYDQMLAEYGLIGLACLFLFYFGYYLKHFKILTYGIPILILVSGILFTDYWFEQLSVLVIFELMLFLNIKENAKNKIAHQP